MYVKQRFDLSVLKERARTSSTSGVELQSLLRYARSSGRPVCGDVVEVDSRVGYVQEACTQWSISSCLSVDAGIPSGYGWGPLRPLSPSLATIHDSDRAALVNDGEFKAREVRMRLSRPTLALELLERYAANIDVPHLRQFVERPQDVVQLLLDSHYEGIETAEQATMVVQRLMFTRDDARVVPPMRTPVAVKVNWLAEYAIELRFATASMLSSMSEAVCLADYNGLSLWYVVTTCERWCVEKAMRALVDKAASSSSSYLYDGFLVEGEGMIVLREKINRAVRKATGWQRVTFEAP
jgi:hypothetical protein